MNVTETLGEGAFGVVVKADAVGLTRYDEEYTTVAIKMLKCMYHSPTNGLQLTQLSLKKGACHFTQWVNVILARSLVNKS